MFISFIDFYRADNDDDEIYASPQEIEDLLADFKDSFHLNKYRIYVEDAAPKDMDFILKDFWNWSEEKIEELKKKAIF